MEHAEERVGSMTGDAFEAIEVRGGKGTAFDSWVIDPILSLYVLILSLGDSIEKQMSDCQIGLVDSN